MSSVKPDTNKYYLPLEKFADTTKYIGRDTFFVERYTHTLKALREPVLINKADSKEIYRFLWLRSFHNPVVIGIVKENNRYNLYWKQSSNNGSETEKLVISKSRQLNKSDWDNFQRLLDKIDFWNMSTIENKLTGDDGSHWIFEGVGKNGYHVTDRWAPHNNDYFNCGEFLIKLTDLEIKRDDIY